MPNKSIANPGLARLTSRRYRLRNKLKFKKNTIIDTRRSGDARYVPFRDVPRSMVNISKV